MSLQMKPKEVAEMIFEEVKWNCQQEDKDILSYIECVASKLPDELEYFIKIRENTDNEFWESVKNEYEKLWTEHLATKIGEELSGFLIAGLEKIDHDPTLTDDERIYLLERYKNFLEELGDVISKALKRQEPLSCVKLREYLLKLYKIAGFIYHGYFDPIEHYVRDYRRLNKVGKLEVLSIFLDNIADVLNDAEKYLKDYNESLLEQEE